MDFELAGRYFGSAFGSAPVDLLMQVQPVEELPMKAYETMGQITSPRVPSPMKPADYLAPKRQSGRFSTEPLSKRKAR